MRRRRWFLLISFIVTLVASSSTAVFAGAAVTKPNIVFILTDDLSSNLVNARFMPNLTKLEATGATLENYFDTDSLCCPSRASIFTGLFPHDTGVLGNGGPTGGFTSFNSHGDENSTVATDLESAGYRTAMMGKYLNKYAVTDPPAPGWNVWDVADWGYPEYHYQLNENNRIVNYGGPNAKGPSNYLTDVVSRLANNFVNTDSAAVVPQPFFLELATFAPHEPYTPAKKYSHLYPNLKYPKTPAFDAATINGPLWLGRRAPLTTTQLTAITTDYRKRAESVKSVDDMIGRLVKTLRQDGKFDNTYFVFTSDNGLHMGEHRLAPGKLTAFDTDIHVPMIVVGPKIPAGLQISPYAENIDLRSTFDAFAGTVPNEPVDGRSFTPLLFNGGAEPANWPQGVLIEHHSQVFTDSDPDKPPPYSGNPPTYEALRLPTALYVEYSDGEREFYDLKTDPYEIDNVYMSLSPLLVSQLHGELVALENCHDDPSCSLVENPVS